MKKIISLTMLCLMTLSTHATTVKITNSTKNSTRVGIYEDALNFRDMRVDAQETREYTSDDTNACITKITINGAIAWQGKKCEDFEITVVQDANGKNTLQSTMLHK